MQRLPAVIAVLALAGLWFFRPQPAVRAQTEPSAQTVLIRFGLTDTVAKTWSGSIEPASDNARVLSISGYHFQPPDTIEGARWTFATRLWTPVFTQTDLSPARNGPRAVFPNGVYAAVTGGPSARFRLSEPALTFSLSDLAEGKTLTAGGGNVEIELAPTPATLSGEPGQADYPAIAVHADGRPAAAWQEYTGDRDRLVVRDPSGSVEKIEAPETADIFRTAAAFDSGGHLHVVWSAQVSGDWDLYERRGTSAGRTIERLTTAAGPDLHHRLAAAPDGSLYLVWQAFRGGQSDIFLRRFTDGAWSEEMRISESRANDWEPAIAVTASGVVWIAWDSYDRGNYDVFLRSLAEGRLSPVRAVTRSPRFEARPAVAADQAGRVWIAYEEAAVNWGKDYGYLFKDRGNPLYQERRLRLVRLAGDRLEEPEAPIATAFPHGHPEFLHAAQLTTDAGGRPVVAALQLTRADRVLEVWAVRGVWEIVTLALDGSAWRRARVLPDSRGAHDVRTALARSADGKVWTAWAADDRLFGNAAPQRQTVRMAPLDVPPSSGDIRMKPFEETPELAFQTHPAEAAQIQAVRNYRIRSGGKEYRIFRGDLHRHTSLSGDGVGDGSLWDFYRYMLDAADMDMATVTDHQGGATAYNWWKTQKSADLFHLPGRLTSLYAYERSVLYPNGHRNIVFTKRGAPILPQQPGEAQGKTRSSEAVWPYLRKYNGIAFRHTIATNQGTDWQDHDNELEPMVEIYQGHRVVYEHEGGPKGATAEKLYLHRSGYQPAGFFWNALAKGHRMGIQASSDHCSTHVSYACILTESDTREGMMGAMRKRHSYGATDNIILDFRVRTGGAEYLQGDELTASGRVTFWVNSIGTGTIRRIDVIHNERYAYTVRPNKAAAQFSYVDPSPVKGENRYYVRLEQEDGHLAWSSPVWVKQ